MQSTNLEGLRRQPTSALTSMIVQSFWTLLKSYWPILAIFIYRGVNEGKMNLTSIAIILLAILAPLIGVIQYLYFTYGIVENKFVIKKGIFKKEEISWPLATIQSIHTSETFLDRMLKLVTVKIDATGTNQDTDEIHISLEEANLLREIILEKGLKSTDNTEEETIENLEVDVISELSTPDLIKLSISANHLKMLGILLAFLFTFLENIKELFYDNYRLFAEETNAQLASSGTVFVLYMFILLLLVSTAISFVKSFLQFANFKITSHPKGLAVKSGLFNSIEQIIRIEKIQFLTWEANWIRKKLPIFLMDFRSIGELDKEKIQLKVPVTSKWLLDHLISYYGTPITESEAHLRISKKFVVRRTLLFACPPAVVVAAIVAYFQPMYSLAILCFPILIYLLNRQYQKKFKVYFNDEVLHIRKGIFGEKEILIKWKYVQSIQIRRSIYQQKKDLASLHFYTAGGEIFIPFLSVTDAQKLADFTVFKIESASPRWL